MTDKDWIAIARDALCRVSKPIEVTSDTKCPQKDKDLAFERLNYLEYQIENGKTK